MFFKKLFLRKEAALEKELEEKDGELNSLRFNVLAWRKIHEEDMQAIRDGQKEITGLMFLLDRKDAEIEELKEQIRGAAP